MKTKNMFLVIISIVLLGYWGNRFFKLTVFKPSSATKMARFDLSGFDIKPYQRANLANDREAREFAQRVNGYKLAQAPNVSDSEVSDRLAQPQKPAALKAITAKNKKDLAKEKKKKALAKKRNARRGGVINNYQQDSLAQQFLNQNREPSQNQNSDFAGSTAGNTTAGSADASAENEDLSEKDARDLEEWRRILLSSPDRANTIEFTRAYQNGAISEVTFYTLVQLMYDQNSSDYQSLAVLAAGSVSSLRSFDFLVNVISNQGASLVASESQRELSEYASVNALTVLKQVLNARTEEEQKIFYATQALDKSTELNLVTDNSSTVSTTLRQLFSSLIPSLENIISIYAQNSEIKTASEKALERIRAAGVVVAQNQNQ